MLVAPLIPALNDPELEAIIAAAAEAGARSAGGILLRLPREVAGLFEEWLRAHRPDRADKVLALMRGARGGELYDASFAQRMRGTGPYADLLANRFRLSQKRLGLNRRDYELAVDRFKRPHEEESKAQLSLW